MLITNNNIQYKSITVMGKKQIYKQKCRDVNDFWYDLILLKL